jgi:hypothetical protein
MYSLLLDNIEYNISGLVFPKFKFFELNPTLIVCCNVHLNNNKINNKIWYELNILYSQLAYINYLLILIFYCQIQMLFLVGISLEYFYLCI